MNIFSWSKTGNSLNGNARYLVVALSLTLSLGFANQCFGASTLVINPAGDGIFTLQGVGVENAAAMDITVAYDASTLSSPRITQGAMISGAMVVVNDTVPGAVRMGIIRTTPFNGTGTIATLAFNRKGDGPGNILAVKASMSNLSGKPLAVQSQVVKQPDAVANDSGAVSSPQNVQTANSAASQGVSGGVLPAMPVVIAVPSNGTASGEKMEPGAGQTAGTDPATDPSSTAGAAVLTADARGMTIAPASDRMKIFRSKSVLERFREYKGTRTPKAFAGLFEQDEMTGFRQNPPVALSDGKTPVRVTFLSNAESAAAADVAVMGARFVSMKKDPDNTNTWIVELVPEKGTCQVSVAVSQGDVKRVYPVTVAPKILAKSRTGIQTEKDLAVYLKGKRLDVNRDKKGDYLDDYIITANYLAAQKQHVVTK